MSSVLHPSDLNVDMSHIDLEWHPTSCEISLSELAKGVNMCAVQPDPQSWNSTHEGNCFVREAIVERAHCAHCAAGTHTYKMSYAMWQIIETGGPLWSLFHPKHLPEGGYAHRVGTTVGSVLVMA